jgi:dihydroxyacetone kinase
VALLVNNLGGTPAMEMSIVARAAVQHLRVTGVTVERVWVGSFMTALEMAGCSLTLLPVDDTTLARLDAPSTAPAWPAAHLGRVPDEVVAAPPPAGDAPAQQHPLPAGSALRAAVAEVAAALVAAEPQLTAMDREVGDGDLGFSLNRAARALLAELDQLPGERPDATLRAMSAIVRRVVGGTSGPLYAVLLLRAAGALDQVSSPGPAEWAAAFRAAVDGVCELGGARPGDSTMVDALVPAADALVAGVTGGNWRLALESAVAAARSGAASTGDLVPRLGRASYVGERAVGRVDPGAQAVAIWLEAVQRALGGALAPTG